MRRPDFLYIGVPKAGSTWLYQILKEHPEVYVPPAKDIYFFDRNYEHGMNWYLSFFRNAGGAHAVGELSHDYYASQETARRIHGHFPDIKLLVCLREPLSWALSAYNYSFDLDIARASFGGPSNASFEEFIALPQIDHMLEYYQCLKPYHELFPKDNILVLFYDELCLDPAGFARAVYSFIGVDPDYAPPSLETRVHPAGKARVRALARVAYRGALILRALGCANLVGRVKTNPVFKRLMYSPPKPGFSPPPEQVDTLKRMVRRNYEQLEELIGRPLPQEWHE